MYIKKSDKLIVAIEDSQPLFDAKELNFREADRISKTLFSKINKKETN